LPPLVAGAVALAVVLLTATGLLGVTMLCVVCRSLELQATSSAVTVPRPAMNDGQAWTVSAA
jgi:hypothetical protein